MASDAARAARLDRVLWTPAASPPHKAGWTLSSPETRARLVQAAIAPDPRFELCTIELERSGASYTVDTLRALRAAQPRWQLALVLGADQMARFSTWKEAASVAGLAQLVVAARDGRAGAGGLPGRRLVRSAVRVAVSSTLVRERVRRGASLSTMVASNVMALIHSEGLYRGAAGRSGSCAAKASEASERPVQGASRGTT